MRLSKSDKSKPLSIASGISDKNSSKISLSSSPDLFKISLINPILMSGSLIRQSTPLNPHAAANILPPLNSLVTISKSPSSRFLPCSSLAQKISLNCVMQIYLRLQLRQSHLHQLGSKKTSRRLRLSNRFDLRE